LAGVLIAPGSTREVLAAHRRAGRTFAAAGVGSFVRDEGAGPNVLCIHGMWGSSFLYRKVILELAQRGLRGIAFDLPGFGLADRPRDYDYSWSGLGRFATAAVQALELDRFHLVVHDIGGPVGFELASTLPDRVASLTIFNTMIDVKTFKPPWSMRPFRRRGAGALWLRGMNRPMFRFLMGLQGVGNRRAVSKAELNAYLELMKREDGGRAFVRVMRSTERTPEKQALYRSVVGNGRYPVQVVWAVDDPALKLDSYGEQARKAARLSKIELMPGKHFPQEDQAAAMADHIAAILRRTVGPGVDGVARV
jgi:pimeloyl-ACP methyl ester carboxylesterase